MGPSGALTTRMAPSICAAQDDHVLDVVRVAGAVYVGVVPVVGGCYSTCWIEMLSHSGLLLGGIVDAVVAHEVGNALRGERLCNGRRQSGLSVVDVADRAYVDMRLVSNGTFPLPFFSLC